MWEIVFWMGDAFDFTIPFREALARITELLGGADEASLVLPPWEEDEDFIEGSLTFGAGTLSVYYEHSLAYLSLGCEQREVVQGAAARILPCVRVENY
jgi:hypothetical protein